MKSRLKHLAISVVVALIVACVVLFVASKFKNDKANSESGVNGFAMGTTYSVTYFGSNSEDTTKNIANYIENTDKNYLAWRAHESVLYKLNNSDKTGNNVVSVEEITANCIFESLEISKKTNGAMDITARPLIALWGIEDGNVTDFSVPDRFELAEALALVNYDNLHIEDKTTFQFKFMDPNQKLDLGAVAKGYMLDLVYDEYLRSDKEDTFAIVQVGGSTMIVGSKSDGSSWKIGVRDPFGNVDDVICSIEFTKEDMSAADKYCISTSGDYEKYIDVDGVRYHHILDPKTGYPVDNGLTSVTVVCPNGLASDAYSTALYVMGEQKATEYVEAHSEEIIGAIFIDKDGSINVTSGLEGKVNFN